MPPLTYIHGFETARTTAGGGMLTVRGCGETMLHRELNIANGEKIMAERFAFGEHSCVPLVASEQSSSGRRLSHLGKFNTCQWHSACTKFGHYKDLITLSCLNL